jgi:hypothetical protein
VRSRAKIGKAAEIPLLPERPSFVLRSSSSSFIVEPSKLQARHYMRQPLKRAPIALAGFLFRLRATGNRLILANPIASASSNSSQLQSEDLLLDLLTIGDKPVYWRVGIGTGTINVSLLPFLD